MFTQLAQRGVADAALGRGHRAQKGQVVILIDQQAQPAAQALSQADGSFVLAVPVAGHYTLQSVSDRHGETRVELDIGSGGSTVTLRLPR